MTNLVQISIPPLTQSMREMMACPASYQAVVIHHVPQLPNPLGALSNEIHALMLAYVAHLRDENVEEDWPFFHSILPLFSEEAQATAAGVIGQIKFNPRSILTTEIRFEFDDASGKPDLVTMESREDATIWDYKNYFDIIEANTFQSKLYSLLLFRHNPAIQTVRFVLVFMRYGVTREVTYRRDHVPYLEGVLASARAEQLNIHERIGLAPAVPGRSCEFCPLLENRECQIDEWNPRATMSDSDRLLYAMYLRAALAHQTKILHESTRNAPVEAHDANGNVYTAKYELKQRHTIPLRPALQVLQEHYTDSGEDLSIKANISRTSLAQLRSARKRAKFDKALRAIETSRDYTKFSITRTTTEPDSNDDDDSENGQ